jgi:hypothetical protein
MSRGKLYGSVAGVLMILAMTLNAIAQQRCGTMQVLQNELARDPQLKARFNNSKVELQIAVNQRLSQPAARESAATVYIPVVFHIVLPDPAIITDEQIQAQLDTLNKDFAGLNADSINIPAAFKPLFGKSAIQFKLAQRTPDNQATNGIVRKITTRSSFSLANDGVKFNASGGDNAWDPARYLNIWVCNISGNILGYATPPGSSAAASQGVVILYRSLPGGSAPYDQGRTLTHETGHYFFLYHIWADDDGACNGSDYVNDTPNQSDATYGCPGGTVVTDDCTKATPGILYQNFMDYTNDACMLLFTKQQVTRMETALNLYRSSLVTSNGAEPPPLKTIDISLNSSSAMPARICKPDLLPVVTLFNKGAQTITSANIITSVDGSPPVTIHWSGSVQSLKNVDAFMNGITLTAGKHTIKITVADPNGSVDMDASNNTLTYVVEYYPPVTIPLSEDFESSTFPPPGWDIVNADRGTTWQKVSALAKSGHGAVMLPNYSYVLNDEKDYLRLPQTDITNTDSAFLSFQVAAAERSNAGVFNILWDTLEVLISTDCGNSYSSLYKKWGASLYTGAATSGSFIPAAAEWRKDSVNLTPYINAGPVMLAFLNTTENGNNIYLDDVRIYKKAAVNPRLREKGWLVTPNPVKDKVTVQFYPLPGNLKSISIFNSAGQKVAGQAIHAGAASYGSYQFDCSRFAGGVYIVQIVFEDRTVYQKIIK